MLGGFYSEIENDFLPGLSLWSTKVVNEFKTVIEHPIQETTWSNKQTLMDKLEMLSIDIEGSISVDIAAGKQLVAKGSFTYLDEESVSYPTTYNIYTTRHPCIPPTTLVLFHELGQ